MSEIISVLLRIDYSEEPKTTLHAKLHLLVLMCFNVSSDQCLKWD